MNASDVVTGGTAVLPPITVRDGGARRAVDLLTRVDVCEVGTEGPAPATLFRIAFRRQHRIAGAIGNIFHSRSGHSAIEDTRIDRAGF